MNNCPACGSEEINKYPGWESGETVSVCSDCGNESTDY